MVAEQNQNEEEEKHEVVPPELGDMLVMDQYCEKYVGLNLVAERMSEADSWSLISQQA